MSTEDFDIDKPWPALAGITPAPVDRAELLWWVPPARDLPDAEVRVLLWLRQADGACDWDVGHWTGEGWLLDWCGAAPEGEVLAWAQPEGPAA